MNISQNNELRQKIEAVIEDLAECYNRSKALILSELDLHCQLYSGLSQIPSLAGNYPTADAGITGPRVHAALSWFDKEGKLAILPDITILEVEHLRILHSQSGGRLPSKQFSFGGNAIIFEIKFCRNPNGITDQFHRKEILKDFEKIKSLQMKLEQEGYPGTLFCYFVIFSKVDKRGWLFQSFLEENEARGQNHKVIYKSGNIQMAENTRRRSRIR